MEDFEAVPLDDLPSKKLYCITKRAGFNGYGFTLESKRKTHCHLITNVEDISPAQIAGLKNNDRILEVNGTDVRACRHSDLVYKIRSCAGNLRLLIDPAAEIENSVNGEKELMTKTAVGVQMTAPKLKEEPLIDEKDVQLRLCHLKLWPEATGYGFFLHEEKGKKGQVIGKVEEHSVAEASGLREGDRVLQINDVDVSDAKHDVVVNLFRQNPSEVKVLVTDLATERFLISKGITVSTLLPYMKHIQCPETNPHVVCQPSETDNIDIKTRYQKIEIQQDSFEVTIEGKEDANDISKEQRNSFQNYHRLRLCCLRNWPDFNGYGFNMHTDKDSVHPYIGRIDKDSPADAGGLRIGDRIIKVNDTDVQKRTHQEIAELIMANKEAVQLLVVDPVAHKYFDDKNISLSADQSFVDVIECPLARVCSQ